MKTLASLLFVAVLAQATNGLNHIGCFRDQGTRALPDFITSGGEVTPEFCVEHCRENGRPYAGVQYASQCFCGTTYDIYGAADNCNMACTGDSNQICGGAWAQNVYSTAEESSVTLSLQVDDKFAVYGNGEEIGSGAGWGTTFNIDISPSIEVVTIRAINGGGPDGIVFTTSNGIISDENIRCVGVSSDAEADSAYPGWKEEGYDDSAWPFAEAYGKIGMSPWGRRPGSEVINDNANWIWAEENSKLYALCRIHLVEPETCPEVREKYAKNIAKLEDLGVEPSFTEDCKFETKQCSDEECFCVKAKNGKRRYRNLVVPLGESYACDKKARRCLKARFEALRQSDADYIPTCNEKGHYTKDQCDTDGSCWCVTEKKGKETKC